MIKTYLISLDLHKKDSETSYVIDDYIDSFDDWGRISESLWAVRTDFNAEQILDKLKLFAPNSSIFVIRASGDAAWSLEPRVSEWLTDNL